MLQDIFGVIFTRKLNDDFVFKLKKKSFSKACCMLMLYFNTENLLGPVCTATQLIPGLFA